jgi:hypothetical protein
MHVECRVRVSRNKRRVTGESVIRETGWCTGRHLLIIEREQGNIPADPLKGFLFREYQLVAGPRYLAVHT